jgi:hypothetical protein
MVFKACWHDLAVSLIKLIRDSFFDITKSHLYTTLFALYEAFITFHYFLHVCSWLLGDKLLKCPTLRPFWNAPTNISWFWLTTMVVASLNLMRYSRRLSLYPWWMLKRLVAVTSLCLLPTNWWTNIKYKFKYPVIECPGRFIYQWRVRSFNVP